MIQEVQDAIVPEELLPYVDRISVFTNELYRQVIQNLSDLALDQDDILEDIFSNTEQVVRYLRVLTSTMIIPILRPSPTDRLSLKIVDWLHQGHPSTQRFPAAVANGDVGIYPYIWLCPIYIFPSVEQQVLLYQPLYFHEFGHLLYRCHQRELDELVQELQGDIGKVLMPRSYRGDRHSTLQRLQRQTVAQTWYAWAQELFCDAVGLTIGGPSFLLALSTYLGTSSRSDFYLTPDQLRFSTHPVTWLRIKLLLSQARAQGLASEADAVEEEWAGIAGVMGIEEDYHGFYDEAFEPFISRMIADAIVETSPRDYLSDEIDDEMVISESDATPVILLNRAWNAFFRAGIDYQEWEMRATGNWIGE